MKNKVSQIQILLSTRKVGGRATAILTPKVKRAKADRKAWRKELD